MDQVTHRQGDVVLIKVAALPKGAKRVEGPIILAHGEVTGHAHQIFGGGCALMEAGSKTFLTADQLLDLTHQEHATLVIEPGVYEVRRQREWSDQDEPRMVLD